MCTGKRGGGSSIITQMNDEARQFYDELKAMTASRNGWQRRAEAAEQQVTFYREAFNQLLKNIVKEISDKPTLPPFCTKHQLFHGQKSPSCRIIAPPPPDEIEDAASHQVK
jgi:hypothetical protein